MSQHIRCSLSLRLYPFGELDELVLCATQRTPLWSNLKGRLMGLRDISRRGAAETACREQRSVLFALDGHRGRPLLADQRDQMLAAVMPGWSCRFSDQV
jgi:hypothetical protein